MIEVVRNSIEIKNAAKFLAIIFVFQFLLRGGLYDYVTIYRF